MNLAAQRRNLVELVNLPLGDRLAAESDHSGKGAGAQAAADREASEPVGKVNNPPFDMNVGWAFEKNRRVQVPARHVHSPMLHTTEQLERNAQQVPERKVNSRLLVPFLSSAPLARQTAPRIGQLPDAANDNDLPREVEAA